MTEAHPLVVAAARELHGAAPETFIARRKELATQAKTAGEKDAAAEIGRLRKPDLAAWALNLAVREAPDVVADLVGLGSRMRAAQASLDVAALKDMKGERDAAIDALVAAASATVADAGGRLAPAAQEAVRSTAIAVLADAAASEAVASGLLTKPLSYSGFGEVDVTDAVAVTGSGVVLTALDGGGSGGTAGTRQEPANGVAFHGDDEARAALEAEVERTEAELTEAQTAESAAAEALSTVRKTLAAAEAELDDARRRYDEALRAADESRAAVAEAETAHARARRNAREVR